MTILALGQFLIILIIGVNLGKCWGHWVGMKKKGWHGHWQRCTAKMEVSRPTR